MNEERLIQWLAGFFVLSTYVATIWISAKAQRSVLPYGLLISLHIAVAARLFMEELDAGGGDAAGNGMQRGFIYLFWLASSVGFGCVTWLLFFGIRLLSGGTSALKAE